MAEIDRDCWAGGVARGRIFRKPLCGSPVVGTARLDAVFLLTGASDDSPCHTASIALHSRDQRPDTSTCGVRNERVVTPDRRHRRDCAFTCLFPLNFRRPGESTDAFAG